MIATLFFGLTLAPVSCESSIIEASQFELASTKRLVPLERLRQTEHGKPSEGLISMGEDLTLHAFDYSGFNRFLIFNKNGGILGSLEGEFKSSLSDQMFRGSADRVGAIESRRTRGLIYVFATWKAPSTELEKNFRLSVHRVDVRDRERVKVERLYPASSEDERVITARSIKESLGTFALQPGSKLNPLPTEIFRFERGYEAVFPFLLSNGLVGIFLEGGQYYVFDGEDPEFPMVYSQEVPEKRPDDPTPGMMNYKRRSVELTEAPVGFGEDYFLISKREIFLYDGSQSETSTVVRFSRVDAIMHGGSSMVTSR